LNAGKIGFGIGIENDMGLTAMNPITIPMAISLLTETRKLRLKFPNSGLEAFTSVQGWRLNNRSLCGR